ncbi:MAG TPA: amidohydrolase family protein, partial [Actinomycetes bacterium]
LGVSPAAALTSATAVPASVVGRSDLGRIVVDAPADLVWWDESYVPRRVWVAGSAVPPIDQAARSSRR